MSSLVGLKEGGLDGPGPDLFAGPAAGPPAMPAALPLPVEEEYAPQLFQLAHTREIMDARDKVPKPAIAASKNKQKKADQKYEQNIRNAVGPVISSLHDRGEISSGPVRDTYKSGHDKGDGFGAESELQGVLPDTFVLHGHYDKDGNAMPGSVGIKDSVAPRGMRLAHEIPDDLGGDSAALKNSEDERLAKAAAVHAGDPAAMFAD